MKFGIVGTNFVSDYFVEATKYITNCEVVSVCSRKRENADKFAKKYDLPNVYDNYLEMIDSKTIDAIYLAVPNNIHCEMSIESLKRRIPTFTEKPFGVNFKEVKYMIKTAKAENTYLHDGIVPLYTENFQILKNSLSKVGKIRKVFLSFEKYSSRYDAYLRGENPTTFQNELCNGSFMDLGIYCVSVAVALFGKPKSILASANLLKTDVDCLGTAIFKYNDFEVVISHSKVSDTKIMSEIQGEEGILQIDIVSLLSNIWFYKKGSLNEIFKISKDVENSFQFQIVDFIKNVEAGNLMSSKVPHQLSLDISEVMTECRTQMGVTYKNDNIH